MFVEDTVATPQTIVDSVEELEVRVGQFLHVCQMVRDATEAGEEITDKQRALMGELGY